MFSLPAAGQVLPVRACRGRVWVAVAFVVAAVQRLPAADAAAEGLAAVAAAAVEVVADAPIALKHDIVLLGNLDNGLGYYRFSYLGSDKAYVGVMAQEVQAVMPGAVTRGGDGYLRVHYERLGIKFLTYKDWLAAGAQIPTRARM